MLPVIIFLSRSLVQSPKAHILAALFHFCFWKCQMPVFRSYCYMKGCKRSSGNPFRGNDLTALLGQLAQHSHSVGGGHWFTDAEDHYNANKVMNWLAHHAWQPEEYEEEDADRVAAKPPHLMARSPRRSRSRSPRRSSASSHAMNCYWKAWQNYQAKCSSAARDFENDVEGLFQ